MKTLAISLLALLNVAAPVPDARAAALFPNRPAVETNVHNAQVTKTFRPENSDGAFHNQPRRHSGPRPGYRRHSDGWWYPLAAFGAGALIGGVLAGQPRAADAGINPRHFDWCASRYRSYRAADNSFQPYSGPRRQCLSPYY